MLIPITIISDFEPTPYVRCIFKSSTRNGKCDCIDMTNSIQQQVATSSWSVTNRNHFHLSTDILFKFFNTTFRFRIITPPKRFRVLLLILNWPYMELYNQCKVNSLFYFWFLKYLAITSIPGKAYRNVQITKHFKDCQTRSGSRTSHTPAPFEHNITDSIEIV